MKQQNFAVGRAVAIITGRIPPPPPPGRAGRHMRAAALKIFRKRHPPDAVIPHGQRMQEAKHILYELEKAGHVGLPRAKTIRGWLKDVQRVRQAPA